KTFRLVARSPPLVAGAPLGAPVDCATEPTRQSLAAQAAGGKSGLHRAGCQVTPGGLAGDGVTTASAAENIPPMAPFSGKAAQVRVKRCGKSAPRGGQPPWQGKPHPEQDQIGVPWRGPRWTRVGR